MKSTQNVGKLLNFHAVLKYTPAMGRAGWDFYLFIFGMGEMVQKLFVQLSTAI
jgi:hypothetical protein